MADSSVRIVFTGDSSSAQGAVKGLSGSFLSLGKVVKGTLAIFGGIKIAQALKSAGQAAVDFDKGMRNVNSIAGLTEGQLKKLSKQVLALAGPTAQTPKVLSEALYDVVSSGFEAGDALKVVEAGAKAATAGLTTADVATGAITAALNAYQLGADDARKVSDILFNTVDKGVLTFEELASSIGDVLPFASQVKVPLEDVGGALATMTLSGLSAAEASTRLKNFIVQMIKPGEDLAKAIDKMGFASGSAMLKQLGLVGTIQQLDKVSKGNSETLASWFGNMRGLGAVLSLGGDQLARFTEITKTMDSATQGAGRTAAVFAEQSKSLSFQWQQAKAALTAAAIPIVQLLFPALTKGAQLVADFASKISAAGPQIKAGFSGFIEPIKAAFEGLVAIGRRVADVVKGIIDVFGGGKGLSGLFKDAETAGRTLGTGLVILTGGLLAYKAAVRAATLATITWEAITTKSVVGMLLKAGIFIGGAIASWFGLKNAMDSATESARQATRPWDEAAAAVERFTQAAATAIPTQAQVRDASLAVTRAQLNVAQAIQYRNQVEREAGKDSLQYLMAQQAVQEAYAALDNAERQRADTLDSTRRATQEARQATRTYLETLFQNLEVTRQTTLAQQRMSIEGGAFKNYLLEWAKIAADGTPKMRLFTAATLALAQQIKRVPSRVEVQAALKDEKFRPALLRALRDLDLLSSKDVKTSVDIKILAKDELKDVNKALDEAKRKKASPEVIIKLQQAKKDLEELLKQIEKADKKKAKPKLELLKEAFFKAIDKANDAIDDLDGEKAKPTVTIDPTPALTAIGAVDRALTTLNGRTAHTYVYTHYRTTGSPSTSRAGGGFIPGADTGGRDSVLTFLAPGELVLNRPQQQALGGPGRLASMFGFSTAGVPGLGVQALAGGGFVSAAGAAKALDRIIAKDKKRSGYKGKSRAVQRLVRRLEDNRGRQDRMARSISQDATEYDISVEEFIKVDADGNETLDTAAVAKRVDEIGKLIGRYQELMGVIDEETEILAQLIAALDAAVKAWQAEIRDQERVIRETTALIRDATKKMNETEDQQVKDSYQKVIDRAERTRDNARSKIGELKGDIETARGDRRSYQGERKDQPLDRRDVDLEIKRLEQERSDVQSIQARPAEPTSAGAEAEAAAAGAEGFAETPTGGESAEETAAMRALIEELRRQVAQLKLALGIERVQLPVIGAFEKGTLYVPQTGLALLHAGESVTTAAVTAARAARAGGSADETIVRLELDPNADRLFDAKVVKAARNVTVLIGQESDRRARAGEAGALSAPHRRL